MGNPRPGGEPGWCVTGAFGVGVSGIVVREDRLHAAHEFVALILAIDQERLSQLWQCTKPIATKDMSAGEHQEQEPAPPWPDKSATLRHRFDGDQARSGWRYACWPAGAGDPVGM